MNNWLLNDDIGKYNDQKPTDVVDDFSVEMSLTQSTVDPTIQHEHPTPLVTPAAATLPQYDSATCCQQCSGFLVHTGKQIQVGELFFPVEKFAVSSGLVKLLNRHARGVRGLTVNVDLVCKVHAHGTCMYGPKCKFMHLCRPFAAEHLHLAIFECPPVPPKSLRAKTTPPPKVHRPAVIIAQPPTVQWPMMMTTQQQQPPSVPMWDHSCPSILSSLSSPMWLDSSQVVPLWVNGTLILSQPAVLPLVLQSFNEVPVMPWVGPVLYV